MNVLANKDTEMNNELSFDSEKFSKHEKIRPEETIDNLSSSKSSSKRSVIGVKSTNILMDQEAVCSSSSNAGDGLDSMLSGADFNGIKRMRLDSADKVNRLYFQRIRNSSENYFTRISKEFRQRRILKNDDAKLTFQEKNLRSEPTGPSDNSRSCWFGRVLGSDIGSTSLPSTRWEN